MQPARLREVLVFQRRNVDAANQTTWIDEFETRGEFQSLGVIPVQDNLDGTIISRITGRFIIRYRPGLSGSTHRIFWKNKVWNILEPIFDPKYRSLTIDASWTDPELET